MPSRTRFILMVVIGVVALLSAGAFAYWHFLLRGPLSGDAAHDFGEVPIFDEPPALQHTFHLTNRLRRPLNIVAIRPDCGCLTARDLRITLQPGEAFDLPITLFPKSGERSALVRVLFDDDTQAMLRVSATGVPQPRLRLKGVSGGAASVTLLADGTAEFDVILDTYRTWDAPAQPTITATSPALAAEFASSEWTLLFRPKDVANAPTTWEGRVRVRFSGDPATLPADAAMTIDFAPARLMSLAIRLSTAPATNEPATRPESQ